MSRNEVGTNLFAKLTSTVNICLTDDDGFAVFANCIGTPPVTVNIFAHGCLINQVNSGTGTAALYQNTGSAAAPVWTLLDTALPGDAASKLIDTNSVTVVDVATVASTVNNLRVTGSATGAVSANAVSLNPVGSDAAVSLSLAPKGATGITTIGLATGTGDIVLGSSSATQTTKIGNGAGIQNVNIANATIAGTTVTIAGGATGLGATDTVNISTGDSGASGLKILNVATGTPGTSGNNRVTIGGGLGTSVTFNSAVSAYRSINYIASETGANNAIAGALVNASGVAITLAAGLRVVVQLGHTLQAGANTFALNGGGALAIKSHFNVANDLATAYAATGIIELLYDGTQWLDMSQ